MANATNLSVEKAAFSVIPPQIDKFANVYYSSFIIKYYLKDIKSNTIINQSIKIKIPPKNIRNNEKSVFRNPQEITVPGNRLFYNETAHI